MTAESFKFEKAFAEYLTANEGTKNSDLGLRYDRLVLSLTERLKAFTADNLDPDMIAVITLTAPILVPSNTCDRIEKEILKNPAREKSFSVNANSVHVKVVTRNAKVPHQSLLLVHNPEVDAKSLLSKAVEWVSEN